MGVYKVICDKDSNKIYEGEFEGEVREGRGSLYYSSGEIKYLGEWKSDVPDGIGVLFYESGMKFYEGEWQKGSASGQGVLFTEDGRREYEGQFANSKKNGMGVIYYEDGSTYQGEWKDDRRDGFGSLFYPSGDLQYRGTWVDSKKHGEGMLLNKGNILSYQGEFFEDKKQGIGKSYYLDGNVEYEGFWYEDEKHGEGVLYGIEGVKIFEGLFEYGKKLVQERIVEHNDEKMEHRDESLESIGIDVEVYDMDGRSIIEDGSKFRFLNEKLGAQNTDYKTDEQWKKNEQNIQNIGGEEEYSEEILEVENEVFGIEYSDEINNLEVLNEYDSTNINDLKETDEDEVVIVESEIFAQEVVNIALEEEKIIVNDDEAKFSYDNEAKEEIEIEQEPVFSKSIEINDEIEEADDEKEIVVEEADGEENEEKEDDEKETVVYEEEEEVSETGIVEVVVEDNKVYKYIEIGDVIYKGEFNEDDRTGYGRVYYKQALKYDGFIKNGVYDGKGKLYDLAEKVEFEGSFKDGKKHGFGISYDSFGNAIYKGEWQYDLQDGEGELLNSNGEQIYKGMFYKGKALGLGVSIESEIDNILYCELESMVGLEEVKDDIARLVSFLKMQILRQRVSYKAMDIPYVFTFEGNIGVGKESVARILGKLYYVLGLIPEYNFIQRDLLTALEYSHDGDIEKSMDNFGGGVLYLSNLYQSNYEDITEVIRSKISTDNILDLVEYSNGHFIIVFSGEEELIEIMIHNKKELAKCVGKSITFFDYSVEEMMDYVQGLSKERDYILSNDLILELQCFFSDLLENDKYNNRNGEFINELFTELVKEQCIRIDTYGVVHIENLKVLELQDFKNIENKICF